MREQGIRMKFNPLDEVAGKRLVIVDDSIVRGSTTRQIVQMLFDAGAAEVHVRISSPPVISPCFYGIDLASEGEMIAANTTIDTATSVQVKQVTVTSGPAVAHRRGSGRSSACRSWPTPVEFHDPADPPRDEGA